MESPVIETSRRDLEQTQPQESDHAQREYVLAELLRGQSPVQIATTLAAAGWPEEQAKSFVQMVSDEHFTPAANQQNETYDRAQRLARKRVKTGVFLLIGGIVWTVFTGIVSPDGHYFVAWGAMLVGGINIFRGVIALDT